MRYRTAHVVLSVCLVAGLAGCSTTKSTGTKTSWWPFGSKSKSITDTTTSLSNAPQAPSFNAAPGAQSGMAAAPNYAGGTQYPVTPYPSTSQVGYNTAPPAGGYMPPSNPYAAPPANQYAAPPAPQYGAPGAANGVNPYVAANPNPANPYGTTPPQDPNATAGTQYGQSPYPGGPSGGAESPYSYTR
jgi:hypothetical protein